MCSCRDGYQEEGDSCYDIDECQYEDVCQDRQECVNTEGGYHCVQNCPTGYGYVKWVILSHVLIELPSDWIKIESKMSV